MFKVIICLASASLTLAAAGATILVADSPQAAGAPIA